MPQRTPSAPDPAPDGPGPSALSIAALLRAAPSPDALLCELLTLLAEGADLSEQARRAALAALEEFHHDTLPRPGLADGDGTPANGKVPHG